MRRAPGMRPGAASALRVVQPHVRLGDPHACSDDRHRLSLLHAVYQPLVRRSADGGHRPGLALSWRCDPSARRWAFTLDPDARWHDGRAVHAEDAVASLRRVRDDPPAGELGTTGVYQCYLGGCAITARDRGRLELVTPAPMADLLDVLAELLVMPAERLDEAAALPPGSGPFRLAERGGDAVVLERVRGALRAGPAARVRFAAMRGAAARAEAVAEGRADLASGVDPSGGGVDLVTVPGHVATACMFGLTRGPTVDPRVRRALNLAVDVPALIDVLHAGWAEPLASPCTATQLGFDPDLEPYPYDPERARSLLAEAGAEGIRLTLDVPSRLPDEAPRLAALLTEQLALVGVALDVVEHADRSAYAEMVREGRIGDAACFDSSPHSSYRLMREKFHAGARGPWWLGYDAPAFDAIVDEAARTPDPDARRALYRRAARQLRDDAPWLFLYAPRLAWARSPALAGWRPRADGLLAFD